MSFGVDSISTVAIARLYNTPGIFLLKPNAWRLISAKKVAALGVESNASLLL
jgi:hypothetical protein